MGTGHLDGRRVLVHSAADLGDDGGVGHSGCGAASMKTWAISVQWCANVHFIDLTNKSRRLTFSGLIYSRTRPFPQSVQRRTKKKWNQVMQTGPGQHPGRPQRWTEQSRPAGCRPVLGHPAVGRRRASSYANSSRRIVPLAQMPSAYLLNLIPKIVQKRHVRHRAGI